MCRSSHAGSTEQADAACSSVSQDSSSTVPIRISSLRMASGPSVAARVEREGQEIEIRELDEDAFRTTESLGIDLSRPERGSDDEEDRRREPASF